MPRWNSLRHRSKMKPASPSKNFIVTLPTTASQTATSAMCLTRSRPSTLPTKLRLPSSSSSSRRLLDGQVALALLLADREQRDARLRDAQDPLGVERAHVGELVEVVAGRVHVGADVEQHERAGLGDHLDGQRRPVHAGQAAELAGPRPPCPRPSDRPSRARRARPCLIRSMATMIERVLLGLEGEGRRLVHLHDLAGRDDLDVRRDRAAGAPRRCAPGCRRAGPCRPGARAPTTASRRRPRAARGRRPWRRRRLGRLRRRPCGPCVRSTGSGRLLRLFLLDLDRRPAGVEAAVPGRRDAICLGWWQCGHGSRCGHAKWPGEHGDRPVGRARLSSWEHPLVWLLLIAPARWGQMAGPGERRGAAIRSVTGYDESYPAQRDRGGSVAVPGPLSSLPRRIRPGGSAGRCG